MDQESDSMLPSEQPATYVCMKSDPHHGTLGLK